MAGQKFTLTFDAQLNVNQMKGALGQIQSTLNGLHLPANITRGLQDSFSKLQREVQGFEAAIGKDITNKADFKKLENQAQKIGEAFEKLKIQLKDLTGLSGKDLEKLFPASVTKNIQTAGNALKQYQNNLNNATKDVNTAEAAVQKLNNAIAKEQGKTVLTGDQYKQLTDNLKSAEQEVVTLEEKLKVLNNEEQRMASSLNQPNKSSKYRQIVKDIQDVNDQLQQARQNAQNLANQKANATTFEKQAKDLNELNIKLKEATDKLNQYKQNLANIQSTGAGGGLKQLLDDIGRLTGMDMSRFSSDTKGAADAIQTYLNQQLQQLSQNLRTAENAVNNAGQPIRTLGNNMRDASQAFQQFNNQSRELDMLKSRIQYFFGLNNAIQLVKRTMREAYKTIKELDKAMTETAVVTDFSVGDMWAQLPEYTKRANELGVTTKAAYEAATLYYQQGLKTNEVMAISNETLKMARIAGLDAAVATDRMTNAVRGFNMEINETNAQRVNDVYSRLAAISASNVDEISTAMTKVASLAHNANMEFETTAAFLAQIIETTRESAETAGTALKTVVARFSEVKKLKDEGELRGSDEEGEVVDVNKVSEALRTAGIDLNKYFLDEVGLDDIFMELASKWNSLTTLQQRYIATQAAGSRQQSRFIALMSDYARTQQLVGEAYKSNGASAKQFEKTQESLESKLARLKNAWNEFAMGILNSDLVKAGVDILTNLLNGINALTSGFGNLNTGAGKFLNTFSKLAILIGTLSLGKGLANGLFASIGGILTGNPLAKGGFANAMLAGVNSGGLVAKMGAKGTLGAMGGMFLNPFVGTGSVIGAGLGKLWGSAKTLGRGIMSNPGVIGNIGSGIGTGLDTLGITSGTTAGIIGLTTALTGVTAAATAAYAIIKKLYDLSPQGQLKIAQKYADALNNVASNAKSSLQEYQNVQDRYKELNANIDNATNSSERSTAIKDRNEYITSLLEQNSAYAEYLSTTFENGEILLTLDEDKLAAAVDKIAEGAVRASAYSEMANAVAAGQQANLYRAKLNGVNLEAGTRTITVEKNGVAAFDSRTTKALTPDEIAKYTRYQAEAEASEAQMRGYVRNAAAQLLNPEALSDEVAGLIADFISLGFDPQKIAGMTQTQQLENWWAGEATEAQLRAEYSRVYGVNPEEGAKKADLAKDVAFAQVMEETTQAQVEQLQELFTSNNHELYEAVLSAIAGSGKITEINFDEIDLEGDTADLYEALGIDENALIDLAHTLSSTDDGFAQMLNSLINQIAAQAKLTKEVQRVNKAKIYSKILQSGVSIDKAVQEFIQSLNAEDTQKAIDLLSSGESLLGGSDSKEYHQLISGLPKLIDTGEIDTLQHVFDSINLNNPIKAFRQLREMEQGASAEVKRYIELIKSANKDLFNKGNMFQSLFQSEDYEEVDKAITKLIDKNGKLSNNDVRDLIDDFDVLQDYIDEDVVSVRSLTKALNAINDGAPIEGLTDSVLDAWDATADLDDLIYELHEHIANFNAGIDYGEGTDFIVDQSDAILELIDNYEFGNEQFKNIWIELFGEDSYRAIMEQYKTMSTTEFHDIVASAVNTLKNFASEEGYEFMEAAARGDFANITGVTRTTGRDANGDETVEFNWNIGSKTTEQVRQQIMDALSVSETTAMGILEGIMAHMGDLAAELKVNDYNAAIQEIVDSSTGAIELSRAELETLAISYGKSLEEVANDLDEVAIKSGKTFEKPILINWTDAAGQPLTKEALQKRFDEEVGMDVALQGAIDEESGKIDADKLLENLKNVGLTDSQAEEIANSIVTTLRTALDTSLGEDGNINKDALVKSLLGEGISPEKADEYADQLIKNINDSLLQRAIKIQKVEFDKDSNELTVTPTVEYAYGDSLEALSSETTEKLQNALEQVNYDEVGKALAAQDYGEVERLLNEAITNGAALGSENAQTSVNGISFETTQEGAKLAITNGVVEGVIESQNWLNQNPITVTVTEVSIPNIHALGAGATGGTVAKGGIVQSFADGTGSHYLQPGWALTGEEGPEVIWNKELGYSYLAGQNGPEFIELVPGDEIFNAQETSRILKNSSFAKGGVFESYARGSWNLDDIRERRSKNSRSSGGGGGGSGSSGSEKEPTKEEWKSNFDWLYNLLEDIEEIERQQKELQDEQNRILQDDNASGIELYQNFVEQSANLLTQLAHQTKTKELREREMNEFMDANKQYSDYFRYNWNDRTLEIDWDAINNIGDKETYEKVEELVSGAEKIQDKMDSAEDAIRSVNDQLRALEDMWRDTYVDFESRVLTAVINSYQKVIDNYSDLNSTITETNNNILNALQEEISLQRQIRDNTQTEEAITDTESQLAYLRRDTTGTNQSKILELQQSLENQRQSYEDELINQAISKLQSDNELAAEQRQHQIDLMQAQLDQQVKEGEFNDYVKEIITSSISSDGTLATDSDLFRLLASEDNIAAMSETSRQVWEEELDNKFKEVTAFLLKEQSEADGSYLTQVAEAINDNVWMSATLLSTDITNGLDGGFSSLGDNFLNGLNSVGVGLEGGFTAMGEGLQLGFNNVGTGLGVIGTGIDSIGMGIGSMSQSMDHVTYTYDDAINGLREANAGLAGLASENASLRSALDYMQAQTQASTEYGLQTIGGSGYTVTDSNGNPVVTQHQGGGYNEVLEDLKKIRGYATGGLATKTGLALLHGTPNEPEYVLNARQTDAFLKLAEVLPSMFNGNSTTNNNLGGNVYVELTMNVSDISSDYDVDRFMDRVKSNIYDAASYRNVNAVNFQR